MAGFISRLVASLVAVVALLQLTHLVLLNKLESRRPAEIQHHDHQIIGSAAVVHADRRTIDSFVNANGRQRRSQSPGSQQNRHVITTEKLALDSTGEFRIIYNVNMGKNRNRNRNRHGRSRSPTAEDVEAVDIDVDVDATLKTSSESILVPITGSTRPHGHGGVGAFGPDYDSPLPLPPANSNDDPNDDVGVTLISASDLTNARRYLISLVERWQGPISLALFARRESEVDDVLEFMTTLQKCHVLVRQFVTFHLVYPASAKAKIPADPSPSHSSQNPPQPLDELDVVQNLMPMLCQNFYKNLLPSVQEQELPEESDRAPISAPHPLPHLRKFPINLLRNVGRRTTRTKYSFVIDIDLLPSEGLRTQFQEFISARTEAGRPRPWRRRRKAKTKTEQPVEVDVDEGNRESDSKVVFVVPAFETKNGETPSTKAELLPLLDSYQARPYYFDLCWKCQVHTDYESWQRESPSVRRQLSVLFEVLWKDPWEPFFISDNRDSATPAYDERFQTEFGYHRLSQLCELHTRGVRFAVLNDAFLIHPSFKTLEAGVTTIPEDRSRNLEANRLHFVNFKQEMSQKYPQSTRRCF